MGKIKTAILNGRPGRIYIQASALAYISIQIITREGIEYDPVQGTPGNRQYRYYPAQGKIEFSVDDPFTMMDRPGERIHITYQ